MEHSNLSRMLSDADGSLTLERATLGEQTVDLLREYIVSGRIPPGTKLIEREVAQLLGTSRVPVRDALRKLEQEGLVIPGSSGRHVIELSERDIRELYRVRVTLERLATELAAENICTDNRAALTATLESMREAVARHDRARHVEVDVEMHRLVWRQADNRHLLRMLTSMVGPIFMFVYNNADAFDWIETLELHEELVACISAGNVPAAARSIERHLENALSRSLQGFRTSKQTP